MGSIASELDDQHSGRIIESSQKQDPRPFLTSLHSSHGPQPTTSISGSCLDMYPTTTTSDSSIGYSAHGARFLDEETEWADPLMFQNLQFGGNLSGSAFPAAGDRCSEISYATESGLSAPVPLPWEGDGSYGELHTGSQADVASFSNILPRVGIQPLVPTLNIDASMNSTVPQNRLSSDHVPLPHPADSGPVAFIDASYKDTVSPPWSSKDRSMPSQSNADKQNLDNMTGNRENQASTFINSTSKDIKTKRNQGVRPSGSYKSEQRLLKKMKEHWEKEMKEHGEKQMKRWEEEIKRWQQQMKEHWGKEIKKAIDSLVELRHSLEEDMDVDM